MLFLPFSGLAAVFGLFGNNQIVALFAFLEQQILAVKQVGIGQRSGGIGQLLFVKRETIGLYHLACFTFGREYLRFLRQQVQRTDTGFEFVQTDFVLLHAVEYIKESSFVQRAQCVRSGVAEQDIRCLYGCVVVSFAMHHACHLFGEAFLEHTEMRRLVVLGDEAFYLLTREAGEYLDVSLCVIVADVHPELIELIRAGVFAAQPDITALGLAELTAVGFGDKRTGEGVGFVAGNFLNELGTGGDVAPLVRTAHLEFAVLMLVQIDKIVSLQQLVGELGERHTLAELAVEALLDAVFGHHIVDGDEFADVSREIKEGVVLHPVVVIDQFGGVGSRRGGNARVAHGYTVRYGGVSPPSAGYARRSYPTGRRSYRLRRPTERWVYGRRPADGAAS